MKKGIGSYPRVRAEGGGRGVVSPAPGRCCWWRRSASPVWNGDIRDGARVAEIAGDVLNGRPSGMRLIVRKERPIPAPNCGSPTPTDYG